MTTVGFDRAWYRLKSHGLLFSQVILIEQSLFSVFGASLPESAPDDTRLQQVAWKGVVPPW